jgi:hypothetical protein
VGHIAPADFAVLALAPLAVGREGNSLIDSIIDGSDETSLLRSQLPTGSMRQPSITKLG